MNKVWKFFEMAGEVATSKKNRRNYLLGAVAVRGDGCIVRSMNGHTPTPDREVHAEYRLCKKLDHDATIYVVRIRTDGTFANARPCKACRKMMRSRRVKKVYYTITSSEYGVYFPMEDEFND